jgi:hypothetical protein
MVSPIGMSSSSFKEEEASKPKEKVVEPLPSQSVPLKETTSNGDGDATSTEGVEALALELLEQDVLAARFKAIQQEPVSVLENGMSTDHRCIWITTDIHTTHLMLRSSTQRLPSDQQVSESLRTA